MRYLPRLICQEAYVILTDLMAAPSGEDGSRFLASNPFFSLAWHFLSLFHVAMICAEVYEVLLVERGFTHKLIQDNLKLF